MKNNKLLKKKIIYRSTHRGTKEMDLLVGRFVKKHIDKIELVNLESLVLTDDETLMKIYHTKKGMNKSLNKVFKLFSEFKI